MSSRQTCVKRAKLHSSGGKERHGAVLEPCGPLPPHEKVVSDGHRLGRAPSKIRLRVQAGRLTILE